MSSLKRMLALSGLTGVLGALAFAIPANAAVKGNCVIDGNAKAQTTKSDTGPAKYVQLLGGKGTFSFNGISINCVTVPVAGKGPATVSGSITASGSFRNSAVAGGVSTPTPCGQGKVLGKIDAVNVSDPKYQVLVGKKFAVEFGPPTNGAFFWHHANPNKPSTPPVKVQPDDDPRYPGKGNTFGTKPYRYAGQIQLSTPSTEPPKANPQAELQKTQNFPNKCTKAFHVSGTVLVDEA